MCSRARSVIALAAVITLLLPAGAGTVSREESDAFARKLEEIQVRGEEERGVALTPPIALRTVITADEFNSWLAFEMAGRLPGVIDPVVVLMAEGRVEGRASLDLETLRRPASAGAIDPLSLLRGQVPIVVTGVVLAEGGEGRFELERATIAGLVVPEALLQELLTRYSRTPERPDGVRLGEPFPLPAGIDRIVVGAGRAVVVQ